MPNSWARCPRLVRARRLIMADPPLRIAYVITSTGIGGAERQVYELASTFRARGWGVGVVSMLPMHESFQPLGAAGVRLASLGMSRGIADPRAVIRLARLLRGWDPHVVHGHMVHANLLTRLTRPVAPSTVVISTMHNQDEGRQWRYYAYRLTDRLADVTTTVSQIAVDEAASRGAAPRERLLLVPNGIRSEQYRPDLSLREAVRSALGLGDRFVWLSVGRLAAAKRHADLLAAMQAVRITAPDVHLLIAGDGPLRAPLEDEIQRSSLAANVSLLGLRGDVPALMQAADGFVLSSAWEGLPMVLLEAAASSLPIVATDVGGSGEAVLDGETGFLTPARQPSKLAEAMLRLMALGPQKRRVMGSRAQRHTEDTFDMNLIADRWEALYRGA